MPIARHSRTLILGLLLAASTAALAADPAPDEILAENSRMKLMRSDYEAELMRIPADQRAAFASDPRRVQQVLNGLLIFKTLAAQARADGLDRDPVVRHRLALENDRVLAQIAVQHLEEKAGAEFDARAKDFEVRARENFLVDQAKYRLPETVSVSHILLDPKAHGGSDDTLALAKKLRQRLAAGEDFAAMARELSDDPTGRTNGGHIDYFVAAQMDAVFAKAAFALKNKGDLSEPVLSQFGWHLIRLDGRRPARQQTFDEARPQIMAELRKHYIDDKRDQAIAAIGRDPSQKANQAAMDALVTHPSESTSGSDAPKADGTKPATPAAGGASPSPAKPDANKSEGAAKSGTSPDASKGTGR